MPIYEYECIDRGHRFEVHQKMSEDPIQTCKECGGKVKKVITAAGFTLKGSGWYKDGYSSSKPASASSSESATSSETKAATSETTTSPTSNKETK